MEKSFIELETKLLARFDEKFYALRELLDERRDAVRVELKLFRKELAVHLSTLNHEAERLKTAADKSVTLEKFEGWVEKIEMMLRAVDERIASLNEDAIREVAERSGEAIANAKLARKESQTATRISLVVAVLSIISWVIALFKLFR